MKKVIDGTDAVRAALNGKSEILVGNEEVRKILPHTGHMLFVDYVVITAEMVIGHFRMSEAACEGHPAWEGKIIFKGSDYYDMAAQILGIFAGKIENPDFKMTKGCVVVHYGEAKFVRSTKPGEQLTMNIKVQDIKVQIRTNGADKAIAYLEGANFIAKVGDEIKAMVSSVKALVV